MLYDLIIIGSGAAGLSAGIYAQRFNLKTLIIGKNFGGYTLTAGKIENYPGFLSIDGLELMQKMKEQAEVLGAEIKEEEVKEIKKENDIFKINDHKARMIIIATGTYRKKLGLKNQDIPGVHYCMTCEGPLYKNQKIAVVGGGNAAIKSAALGEQYAEAVYILVRSDRLRADPVNIAKLKKAEILYNSEVKEIIGKEKLEKLVLNNARELVVDGLFVEIGASPNIIPGLGLDLDLSGRIKVNSKMETSVKGVYAAGDVCDLFGSFNQDLTAAAMGAVAANSVYQELSTKPV